MAEERHSVFIIELAIDEDPATTHALILEADLAIDSMGPRIVREHASRGRSGLAADGLEPQPLRRCFFAALRAA